MLADLLDEQESLKKGDLAHQIAGQQEALDKARAARPKCRIWQGRARQARLLTWPSLALGGSTLSGGDTQLLIAPSEAKVPSPGRPKVAPLTAFGPQARKKEYQARKQKNAAATLIQRFALRRLAPY